MLIVLCCRGHRIRRVSCTSEGSSGLSDDECDSVGEAPLRNARRLDAMQDAILDVSLESDKIESSPNPEEVRYTFNRYRLHMQYLQFRNMYGVKNSKKMLTLLVWTSMESRPNDPAGGACDPGLAVSRAIILRFYQHGVGKPELCYSFTVDPSLCVT